MVDKISTPPANSKVVQLKTRGMTQKNPKMQTLRSLNPMMKLDHVMVNNRIYLTDMICYKLQSIVLILDCVRGQGKPNATQYYLVIPVRNIRDASRF